MGTIAKHSHKLAWRSLIDNPARIEVRNRQGPLPPVDSFDSDRSPVSVHNIFSATMVLILQFSLSRNLSGTTVPAKRYKSPHREKSK
jgi:hypothetical protein